MRRQILFISDDDDTSNRLRIALSKTTPECELRFAEDKLTTESFPSPSLILLDLMLAHDAAFEMLHWLRNDQAYRQVPVFVLGSEVIENDINQAYALGANACLIKPSGEYGLEPLAQGIATYASLLPILTSDSCA